jgi:hypothetical protein
MKDRVTVRRNELEKAELNLLMKTFRVEVESEAYKMAVKWVNNYLKNVTESFFPPNYEVILVKKSKTNKVDRKVYD